MMYHFNALHYLFLTDSHTRLFINKMSAIATLLAAGAAASYQCPGSPAFVYASCEVTAIVKGSCSLVGVEIANRLTGVDGWTDPHNGGTYKMTQNTSTSISGQRETGSAPHTPGKHYTDKFTLTLTPIDSFTCSVAACSESQSASFLDFSTNYCDVRNLYCGRADGCTPVSFDFNNTESFGDCKQHDPTQCIVKPQPPAVVENLKESYKCPGSPHALHASCEVSALANATCFQVMNEANARANGTSGWVDPHHGGIYSLTTVTPTLIEGTHKTGKSPHFTDKFILTLANVNGKCQISSCSESQVTSVLDGSTNYCNVHNLYSNDVKSALFSFSSIESFGTCHEHTASDCH